MAKQRPDLILMDIQLPGIDGYEVTRRIKADPALRSITIIAVTSYALSGEEQKARAAGCDEYVPKPYSPRQLLRKSRTGTYPEPQAEIAYDTFYQPDLSENIDSPFVRDGNNKLVRRSYWLDMNDRTLVMVMTNGIGANLTNDEKRAHLADLRREHLIDQVCIQEILPPEK